jgi:hypothetical protein
MSTFVSDMTVYRVTFQDGHEVDYWARSAEDAADNFGPEMRALIVCITRLVDWTRFVW